MINVKARKERKAEFRRNEIQDFSFSYAPEWYASDFVRLVLFAILLFPSCGLSIFAIIFSLYMASPLHLVITLKDAKKIKIPICQRADVSEFLRAVGYSKEKIEKNETRRISGKAWSMRERLITTVLFFIAGVTLVFGMALFLEMI